MCYVYAILYFTSQSGKLEVLANNLWQHMEKCDLCPRNCGANRLFGEKGTCGADASLRIASFGPHFGEERELVGKGGSGTIFCHIVHCSAFLYQFGY